MGKHKLRYHVLLPITVFVVLVFVGVPVVANAFSVGRRGSSCQP